MDCEIMHVVVEDARQAFPEEMVSFGHGFSSWLERPQLTCRVSPLDPSIARCMFFQATPLKI